MRCLCSISSEVGMHLLGGKALFLSSDDIQLGVNETLKVGRCAQHHGIGHVEP